MPKMADLAEERWAPGEDAKDAEATEHTQRSIAKAKDMYQRSASFETCIEQVRLQAHWSHQKVRRR